MRRKRWIKASLLTMIAATPVVPMLSVANAAPAAGDPDAVAQLVKVIENDPLQFKREDAAVQLVNRPDSSNQIDLILKNPGEQPGQIAVATALAKSLYPDAAFIPDLVRLLGSNPDLTDAAAQALAAMSFEPQSEAFKALRHFVEDTRNADNTRIKAIGAMGQIVQQPAADSLIQLLGGANQNPLISNAATDALANLTGITSYGNDIHQWQKWWNGVKTKTPAEFRSQVLETRDLQFKIFKQRHAQFLKAARVRLKENYIALLNLDKEVASKTLLSYLDDRTPDIRDLGVSLIGDDPLKRFVGKVGEQLLKMINDPDDSVRSHVIGVLLTVNPQDARDLLIAQLKIETNLQIQIEIINALGKLEDVAAVKPLLDLLHDPQHPQPEIVIAAASAISNLGAKLRQKDPNSADQASVELRKIVDPAAAVRARDDVRAACVSALAALRDKDSFDLFKQLAQPGETSSQVRQAALLGFQNLGDTNADQIVANQLDDKDSEVRAAAAAALQTTATPVDAEKIFQTMKNDNYKKVEDALWVALQNLYPKETTDELNRIAGELTDDPDKRLVTLQKLGDALAAANNEKDVALNQQVIAEAMMAVKPQRVQEAIDNLNKALKYWRGHGNHDMQEGLVGSLLDAYLEAKQWSEATRFAADQIKIDPVYQTAVWPKIKAKAEALSTSTSTTDRDAANALIDNALKMDPPLEPTYVGLLHQFQEAMKAAPPPG